MLIADDHRPTREDVRLALEHDGGFDVCAVAADAPGAIAEALRTGPDICLLDVHMPGSGLAAVWELHVRLPDMPIVMLTVSEDDRDVFAAMRAGASGYLLKDMDPRAIPDELRSVLRGEFALPRPLVGRVVERFRDPAALRRKLVAGDRPQLTSREWQILDLLRRRLTTSEIARRLVVSPVTVRTHVAALLRKFGVADRDELLERFDDPPQR